MKSSPYSLFQSLFLNLRKPAPEQHSGGEGTSFHHSNIPAFQSRFVLITLLTLAFWMPLIAQQTVNIGIVLDGPWERNEEVGQLLQQEIASLLDPEFDVRFPLNAFRISDWTVGGIKNDIDDLLNDPNVDILLTLGVVSSHEICQRDYLPKPVIAPIILDLDLQGIPVSSGASGVNNLCYIAVPLTIERDILAFREIYEFKNLLVLINRPLYEAIPEIHQKTERILASHGLKGTIQPVAESADEAISSMTDEFDAVYVTPLIQLGTGEFDKVVTALKQKRLPSFSLFGYREVQQGILAGQSPDIFPRLSRRIALNIQRIILGEDAGTIPYAFPAIEHFAINMATSREIGVYPKWSILTEAELINDEREQLDRVMTIEAAVQQGITRNLDLVVKDLETLAAEAEVNLARANLLPQLDLSLTGVQIDADRAGSFQAEQTLSGTATATQILFSERAFANYSIQKSLQSARELDREAVKLDIGQIIATAYLQLLQAKTFERIQKDNLQLTRSNLDLARIRESVGYSGRAEVYRWESQVASSRKAVIDANTQRNQAEIQVNRLLNESLESDFLTAESQLADTTLMTPYNPYIKFIDNPWSFKAFRRFLVVEGLKNSPEIQQLDAAIAAQERLLKSTNRSFILPDVVAQAEISNRFIEEGEGSEEATIADPTLAPLLSAFDTGDDVNWSVALNASIPLLEGGAKLARRHQALETLNQLRTQRRSINEKIEQRIRSAAHTTGSAYAGIQQTFLAAEAAEKNLELVIDAYSRGVLTITQLLDAQNAALGARNAAANSVYEFLISIMELHRSVGRLAYLETPEEEAEFLLRAEEFFEAEGISVK